MSKFSKIFISLFLVISSFTNVAQKPFELFNSKSEHFYDGLFASAGYTLRGLRPDSSSFIMGDSVYYHYRIYKDLGSCKKSNYPSWLGYKTIRKSNEDYIFFTKTNDTILIKAGAQVGTNWIYYRFSNGNYLRATLSSKGFSVTYDGLSDTVKTISFQCFNPSNNPIYHYYNTKTLKIARSQGLITSGIYFDFPNDTSFVNRSYGKHLTNKEVFDNSIGDIIQIRNIYNNNQPPPNNVSSVIYTTDTIASKIYITPDSVHLTNTIGQTRRHGQLNKYAVVQMPQQALITNWFSAYSEIREVHYKIDTTGNCRKTLIYFITDYCNHFTSSPTDTCFSTGSVSCTNYGLEQFQEGAGHIIDELFMGIGVARTSRKITFTKLNNIMCGNFYSTGILDNYLISDINIYPNPTSEYFIINSELLQGYKLILTDAIGKEYINDNFIKNQKINIDFLNSGVYFVRLEAENSTYLFKLVKQ